MLPDPIRIRGKETRQITVTFKGAAPGEVALALTSGGTCVFAEGKTIHRGKKANGAGEFRVITSVKCQCRSPNSVVNTVVRAKISDSAGSSGNDGAPLIYSCGR